MSDSFTVSNGTRQGSILSPFLVARYIRDLLNALLSGRVGFHIVGRVINVLAYAEFVSEFKYLDHVINGCMSGHDKVN